MHPATRAFTSRRTAAIRVAAKVDSPEALEAALQLTEIDLPHDLPPGYAVVAIRYAGVNPSDVRAVLGGMPHAIWPRTPGRDYAGVVVEGPQQLLGREVWGSGGDLGIRRDGTHARHLVLPAANLPQKPTGITLAEAGGVGVPFITAYEGLREAGPVRPGDVVLVLGANGKVGQAAIQLATAAGARVFGVERTPEPYSGPAMGEVAIFGASEGDIAERVRDATDGHGVDIVFNTVGSPYFEAACRAMAIGGRQILISTIERVVPLDIFTFYRGRHRFIGIDTLALDNGYGAAVLDALRPGFENRTLRPFPVPAANIYPHPARPRPTGRSWTAHESASFSTPRYRRHQYHEATGSLSPVAGG